MPDEVMLEVRTERLPGRTLVYCKGKIVSSTASQVRAVVKPLITTGATVVLDLSAVTFMDSMGLGTVATLWVSSKNAACQLAMVNLSPRIRDLFTVTHLLSLFEAAGETNSQIP